MVFVLVCAMRTHDYFVSEFDPFIPLHIALPLGAGRGALDWATRLASEWRWGYGAYKDVVR